MNAASLLHEFHRRGVRLWVEAGSVLARPLSAVTPNLRKIAADHKAELLALLAVPAVPDSEENAIDRVARFDGWLPPSEIPAAVAREIQRIEPDALRLGWSKARLWNFNFWPRPRYEPRGLASVMNDDDAIVAVSKDYIAIGSRGRKSEDYRRFWRLDG
jgi:hypothetical protein